MMEVEIRTWHLSKNCWVLDLVEGYLKKIQAFEKISFKMIKDEKNWLRRIDRADRVWLCDETGPPQTSVEFAQCLSRLRDGGCRRLFILLGGPFGFSEEIKKRGDRLILLSPFVMNQQVALTVVMEQIFRAYTVINNHPYHND